MKKLIVSMMLIISMFAFAAESDPSATVGYIKYDLVAPSTGYNTIALPLDTGYSASEVLGDDITNCTQVSYYDATNQGWVASGKGDFGWTNTFGVSYGQGLQVLVDAASSFVADGDLIADPVYNLECPSTGYNMIMQPLTYSGTAWDMSDELGNDITGCTQVSYFDAANQGWVASGKGDFGWTNTFSTSFGNAYQVLVDAPTTWPSAKSNEFTPFTGQNPEMPKGNIRNVFYHCQDAAGLEYDFTAAPYDNITFRGWILGRESEILDESSAGSGWEMLGGAYSAVFVQIGNFPTPWAAGDQVVFKVKDETDPDFNNWVYGTATTEALDGEGTDYYGGFDAEGYGGGPVMLVDNPTSIEEGNIPTKTALHQNYPNPFNPATTIKFDLASNTNVKLNVYNYNGQMVKSLVSGQMDAGYHAVNFDASNLSAGVYYYTLEADSKVMTNKMVLVK